MPGDTQLAQGKDRFGRGVNAVPKSFLSSMKPEHISTAGFLSLKQIADRHTGRAPEMFHGEKKKKKTVWKIFILPTKKPRGMQDGFGKAAALTWACGSSLPQASAGSCR